MAITDPGSVLIIGAGASVPFGLPLGGDLIERIRRQLDAELEHINKRFERNAAQVYSSHLVRAIPLAAGLPFCNALHEQNDSRGRMIEADARHYAGQLRGLRDLLTGQTSETIDDFIAINPKQANLVKIGIAIVFFGILYTEETAPKHYKKRALSDRVVGLTQKTARRNWVHHLINIVRHHNFGKVREEVNKVRIISFNYDPVVETILNEQFDNTEHDFGPWQDYIEVVHPHGFMGEIESEIYDPIPILLKWAKAICVVKELEITAYAKKTRSRATEWLRDASEVYMTGFALSGPNAKLLGLGDTENTPQKWFISNFDGSPALRRIAENYDRKPARRVRGGTDDGRLGYWGKIETEIESGTRGDELHIDTWFEIGIPGEMPA